MFLKNGYKTNMDEALKILVKDKKFNDEDLKNAYIKKNKIYY